MELKKILPFFFLAVFLWSEGAAQTRSDTAVAGVKLPLFSLQPAASFDKKRFYVSAITGVVVYGGISVALWNAWYQDYPLTGFHTFNDAGEWNQMDKTGHFFSAYTGSNYAFQGARWTGMGRRKAMWTAAGVGLGIMSTIEVMDGFSEQWGFSLSDMGFNGLGTGLFVVQELWWQQQRITPKVSALRPDYSKQQIYSVDRGDSTTLEARTAELYGTQFHNVLLKDYNGLTCWVSVNIAACLKKENRFPSWLNVAAGYGAGNIYGGFENTWTTDEGAEFVLDRTKYPRYRQFYLSPDIDFTKIKTRHRWLRMTLAALNWLKFPAPALEWNTRGHTKFHYLHW